MHKWNNASVRIGYINLQQKYQRLRACEGREKGKQRICESVFRNGAKHLAITSGENTLFPSETGHVIAIAGYLTATKRVKSESEKLQIRLETSARLVLRNFPQNLYRNDTDIDNR